MVGMRVTKVCGRTLGVAGATFAVLLLLTVGSADAAFPGRNGLLAVQPLKGRETVLVEPDGSGKRLVCLVEPTCGFGYYYRPMWSPDGRTLLLDGEWAHDFSGGVGIYPDGTWAFDFEGEGGAFTANPTLLTGLDNGRLIEYGTDGLARKVLPSRTGKSGPLWSSRGEMTLVRGGWIWVGSPGKLRRFMRGSAPAWSPDGARIVFVRGGWLMTAPVGRRSRRLVRGTAPAWSPDGRWIAFFAKGHRLSLIRADGGRVRRVPGVEGWNVDWQPIPAKPPVACQAPPGSEVIASNDTDVLSVDHVPVSAPFGADFAALGCWRPAGREIPLSSLTLGLGDIEPADVSAGAVNGPYAAIVTYWSSTGYATSGPGSFGQPRYRHNSVEVFDLQAFAEGQTSPIGGGESTSCVYDTGTTCVIDKLVLGADGVSAAHINDVNNNCTCTVEQIQARDGTGVHTLDSVTEPDASSPSLTNLALAGDTLTWDHQGTAESAQLQPPGSAPPPTLNTP